MSNTDVSNTTTDVPVVTVTVSVPVANVANVAVANDSLKERVFQKVEAILDDVQAELAKVAGEVEDKVESFIEKKI
jgi:hypothetical protein